MFQALLAVFRVHPELRDDRSWCGSFSESGKPRLFQSLLAFFRTLSALPDEWRIRRQLRHEARIRLQTAEDFPLDHIIARYCNQEGIDPKRARKILRELHRYLVICALHPEEQVMLHAPTIDKLWRLFIGSTREYADYCQRIAGRFIDHRLGPEDKDLADYTQFLQFIYLYRICFGGLPPRALWSMWPMMGTYLNAPG